MGSNAKSLSADEMFCHAIYSTWHVVNRSYKKHLSRLGLTYPQYITLTLLWETDHRNVSDIASALAMETNTLTPLLKRLEANGLVSRRRSQEDERQVVVSLTSEGRELQSNAEKITVCMIRDTGLKQRELEGLIDALSSMRTSLGKTLVSDQ